MKQNELAKKLEKTNAAISDYEKGKSTPPIEVALKLCEIFDVDLNTLVLKDFKKEKIEQTTAGTSNQQLTSNIETLERINQLQEQRLAELEREIKEQAPALAERLGLE